MLVWMAALAGCAAAEPEEREPQPSIEVVADAGAGLPPCADAGEDVESCVASDGVVQEPGPPVYVDTAVSYGPDAANK